MKYYFKHILMILWKECIITANYQLRSEVISSGLVDKINHINKQIYHAVKTDDYYLAKTLQYELLFIESENPQNFNEAVKCLRSSRSRAYRLKKRIKKFLEGGECVFLTLTFRDDVLEKTSAATRKKYVQRCLKQWSNKYVANIDYGSKTEREHYHAVVCSPFVDMSIWKYGFPYAEHINPTSEPLRLAHYINKLTNHAIKETCRRNAIIFSKDVARFSS